MAKSNHEPHRFQARLCSYRGTRGEEGGILWVIEGDGEVFVSGDVWEFRGFVGVAP